MFRPSLSITLLAAAAAASLLSSQRLAAQSTAASTAPAVVRPAAAESELGTDDAVNMRRLVNEESLHRDRVARLERLRALAEQRGLRERLTELDRLDRLESERFEARTLAARSHMSEHALRQADDFVRRGGVIKVRRANQSADHDPQRTTRPGSNAEAERAAVQRKAATTRPATRPSATRSGTTSRGRTGSGGRSPR